MTVALFTAAVALVSGLITTAVTGWLSARAKVSEELRELRLTEYPPLWKRTSIVSRHPQTNASYDDLKGLHFDLRQWYYGLGGVAMSKRSRDRFMELQKLIGTHLARDANTEKSELEPDTYEGVRELASALRTGLTDDLESRRQRSLLWTFGRWLDHRRLKKQAAGYQRAAEGRGQTQPRPVQWTLEPDELELEAPAAPTDAAG